MMSGNNFVIRMPFSVAALATIQQAQHAQQLDRNILAAQLLQQQQQQQQQQLQSSGSPSSLNVPLAASPNAAPLGSMDNVMNVSLNGGLGADVLGIGLAAENKARRRLTVEETALLTQYFRQNPRPTVHERLRLSQLLKLSERTVQIWFQNKRAKVRKETSATSGIRGSGINGAAGAAFSSLFASNDSSLSSLNDLDNDEDASMSRATSKDSLSTEQSVSGLDNNASAETSVDSASRATVLTTEKQRLQHQLKLRRAVTLPAISYLSHEVLLSEKGPVYRDVLFAPPHPTYQPTNGKRKHYMIPVSSESTPTLKFLPKPETSATIDEALANISTNLEDNSSFDEEMFQSLGEILGAGEDLSLLSPATTTSTGTGSMHSSAANSRSATPPNDHESLSHVQKRLRTI